MPPTVSSALISSIRPVGIFFFFVVGTTRPPSFSRMRFLSSASPGSGSSVAMSAARQAASGRRAGQMCRVEICPCRTFFSWTESSEACLSGKAVSMRRRPSDTGRRRLSQELLPGNWSRSGWPKLVDEARCDCSDRVPVLTANLHAHAVREVTRQGGDTRQNKNLPAAGNRHVEEAALLFQGQSCSVSLPVSGRLGIRPSIHPITTTRSAVRPFDLCRLMTRT